MSNDRDIRDTRSAADVKRVPLAKQNMMKFKQDPNFAYRVVNELPGAVDSYNLAGWEVVSDSKADLSDRDASKPSQQGSVQRPVVNKDPNAACRHGVLMRKPLKWYEEDTSAKQAVNDEIEKQLDPRFNKKLGDYGEMSIRHDTLSDKK